jgi:glucose/arabinose dehydrogenase
VTLPTRAALATGVLLLAATGCGGDDDAKYDANDQQGSAVIATTTPAGAATSPSDAATGTAIPSATAPPAGTAGTGAPPASATGTEPPGTPRPASAVGDPQVEFVTIAELAAPVDLAWRSGDPTLYVVGQAGTITAVDAATGATRPVLDITDLTDAAGERGLLGLDFAPAGNRAYVNYIDANGDTVIAEFAVGPDGTFDPASERVLLNVDQPYSNHNGGDLAIGPDGMLYIALGDGGSGGDPERRALDVGTLLGKISRIDPTVPTELPYTVPGDNPFAGTEGALGEIWSIGLRNPWKFTFDPVTHDLWIADVGQNQIEEVDFVAAPADGSVAGRGASFGWSAYEGNARFNDDQPADGHVAPVLTYTHADGCSISGGAPYRGAAIPDLWGGYVYSDYCSGTVWVLDLAGARNLELGNVPSVTAVVAGPDQELYVLSAEGSVNRIVPVS